MFHSPLDIIRYLIVCRVNAPMVWFHHFPPLEFSLVLGTIIADSLPTVQARPWRKALEVWKPYGGISLIKNKNLKNPPYAKWPVESVLFCYPGKRAYGEGELIFLELKLIGDAADHAFFLEVILPALEKASSVIDTRWQRSDSLWGRFDVQNIYVARGPNWDTLVEDSTLDLKYVPTSYQWSEGLVLEPVPLKTFQDLTWVTPFDLQSDGDDRPSRRYKQIPPEHIPSLKDILISFMIRMNSLSAGKGERVELWDVLNQDAMDSFERMMASELDVPMTHGNFYPVLESQPGRWIGKQTFESIPDAIIPYLSLASIFHVGAHTHFGCGTFILE